MFIFPSKYTCCVYTCFNNMLNISSETHITNTTDRLNQNQLLVTKATNGTMYVGI